MIIKGFKNYCTVVIMAFIFGMGITIFVTDYFGDCALKIMECEAKAADIMGKRVDWFAKANGRRGNCCVKKRDYI